MKNFVLCFALLLCNLSVAQEQRPYVGRVTIVENDKPISYGSFSLVDEDLGLTCWHVIREVLEDDKRTICLEFKSGEVRSATILKHDQLFDLALLQFVGEVESDRVGLGDWSSTITVAGFKHGKTYFETIGEYEYDIISVGRTDSNGKVTMSPCNTRDGDPAMFVMKGEVFPGMSGGPAIGEDGYLSGVVWGRCKKEAYVTGINAVYEFLEGTAIEPKVFRPFSP